MKIDAKMYQELLECLIEINLTMEADQGRFIKLLASQ